MRHRHHHHRGHRPDEAGAPERKNRWNSDARAERRGEAPRSGSSRPNWEPREKTSNSRFAPRDHDARNAERGRDGGAPRFGRDGGKEAARAGRDGRPARSWDRDARPARDSGGRDDRAEHGHRLLVVVDPSHGQEPRGQVGAHVARGGHRAGRQEAALEQQLGDGVAFAGVSRYPARVKCALLPWTAYLDALARAGVDISAASSGAAPTTTARTTLEES